jgi:hypothetical protein
MWQNAISAEARIRQLEEGIEPEVTLVIEGMSKVYDLGKRMTEECKEVLMILASEKTILRNEGLFGKLAYKQQQLGFDIRILVSNLDQSVIEVLPHAEWRRMQHQINVSIIIYDRSRMFITQYTNTEADHGTSSLHKHL